MLTYAFRLPPFHQLFVIMFLSLPKITHCHYVNAWAFERHVSGF